MPQPSTAPDTVCEDLRQDVPPEIIARADECKAFPRARRLTTPPQVLRAGLLSCGRDQSLREVAGPMTLLGARLTESAMAERLAAWRPWVKALLPTRLGSGARPLRPQGRRGMVMAGSTGQAPGATGLP